MAARLEHETTPASCVTLPRCRSKTLPTFSNISHLIPTQPLLHMVQHVAGWDAPFPRSQHFPLPPPLFFPSLCAQELGTIVILQQISLVYLTVGIFLQIYFIWHV